MMSENRYNFGAEGIQSIDTSNTVDGKPIYYWVNQQDQEIPDDAGYAGVVNCTNITVRDLTLINNDQSVLFVCTNNSRIENVNVSNNNYSIVLLESSDNNLITENTTDSNRYSGISMQYSSNNTFTNNITSSNNDHGICLASSSNNVLTGNNASNNDCGIMMWGSNNNTITTNLVQNNTDRGFYIPGNTNNNISYNNIIKNGNCNTSIGGWEWQFYNDQSEAVDAKHNYWGAGMNSSTIDVSIHDDEEGWGEVEFYPFETEPIPCAPSPEAPHTFTAEDVVIALQIAAGSRPPDLRGDGSATSLDVLMILQKVCGNIDLS